MDDRGVSSVLGYALSLTIVTLLITGVFLGMAEFVEDQRERAIRTETGVLGNRIAADLAALDRMVVATGGTGDARIETALPSSVAGRLYTIEVGTLAGGDPTAVNLTTEDPAVSVTVRVATETPVAETTLAGGDLVLGYDGTELVIRRG